MSVLNFVSPLALVSSGIFPIFPASAVAIAAVPGGITGAPAVGSIEETDDGGDGDDHCVSGVDGAGAGAGVERESAEPGGGGADRIGTYEGGREVSGT